MPILKNNRHEKFTLALVNGMSQTDAAIEAGYKKSRARFTGSRLATISNIIKRREELSKLAQSKTIMSVIERRERLSELGREPIRQPATAKEVVISIAELNKMGGDYPPSRVEVEPGETLAPMLLDLLARLRGYGNQDKR